MPETQRQVQSMITDILEEDKAEDEHETEISCYLQDAGPSLDASIPALYPTIMHLQKIQGAMISAGISPASFKSDAEC